MTKFLTRRKKIKCESIIRLLLKKEIDIKTINLDRRTPLIIVAEYKKEILIRLLLKNKVSIKA